MQNRYDNDDLSHALKVGVVACAAGAALVLSMVMGGPLETSGDYPADNVKLAAHAVAQPQPAAAPTASDSGWYHDAPFATGRGGDSEPSPLPQ